MFMYSEGLVICRFRQDLRHKTKHRNSCSVLDMDGQISTAVGIGRNACHQINQTILGTVASTDRSSQMPCMTDVNAFLAPWRRIWTCAMSR